jgi:uncharacterized NAD(P)/FAD-binding protein YdhS
VWSRDVDDLDRGRGRGPGGARPDLVTWLAAHHPDWADRDAFVPRRLVGAYLQAAFDALLGSLPAQLTVDRVTGVVTDVRRCGARWRVHHDDPALDRAVDEVMVTVGHGTWSPASTPTDTVAPSAVVSPPATAPRGGLAPLPTIAPPYPVTARLSPERIPPGATVAVRGFALSFIDTVLALTVGRGGRFEGIGGADPRAARYHASGAEVARILPFARTGLPLLAKPGPALVARAGELTPLWDRLRGRVGAHADPALRPELRAALAEAAAAALRQLRDPVPDDELEAIDALLAADRRAPATVSSDRGPGAMAAGGHPGRDPGCGARRLAAMRRSVAVAHGHRAPDAAWAVGEAWRQGYPALVARVGHGGVPVAERPDLDALAVRMERLAFGAPADNLERVIVLVEAGLVDLEHLCAPRMAAEGAGFALVTGSRRTRVDLLVDAVIDPPGIAPGTPLWGRLLRRGQVRRGAGTRGVEITADATCVDREGRRVPGLAAVGRATEGWVLGNDTLSRTLHDETRRWAHRVLAGDVSRRDASDAGSRALTGAQP